MSVWTSVEALQRYAYTSAHRELLRARSSWFEKFDGRKLAYLRDHGESQHAFSFARPFPPLLLA